MGANAARRFMMSYVREQTYDQLQRSKVKVAVLGRHVTFNVDKACRKTLNFDKIAIGYRGKL